MTPEHQQLQDSMKKVDKYLYRFDNEMLWYVIKRCESILNYRADKDGDNNG